MRRASLIFVIAAALFQARWVRSKAFRVIPAIRARPLRPDFDVIQMAPVYTASNISQGAAPTIASFTASSQSVSAATPVTLSWSVTGASFLIVSPDIGAVRGTRERPSRQHNRPRTRYTPRTLSATPQRQS
jgi:hypothetical protein